MIQPAEAFAFATRRFVGVQTLFASDELAWDNGDPVSGQARDLSRGLGRWHGPAPLHVECSLILLGASTYTWRQDIVARLSTSAPRRLRVGLKGLFTSITPDVAMPLFEGPLALRVLVQNAATGAIVSSTRDYVVDPAQAQVLEVPELPVGSSIIWCRVEEVKAAQALPPDYLTVTGYGSLATVPLQFVYVDEDGDERVWDWLRDVGLRPSNPAQLAVDGTSMYVAHQAAILDGTLLHRGEWTQYIRDGAAHGCDWSALRVVVSDDANAVWSANSALLPAPHAPLFEIMGAGPRAAIAVDPLARSITAWCAETASTCLIAGSIATSTGPALALWRMSVSAQDVLFFDLLGVHANDNAFVCEMALLGNFASDVLIRQVPSAGFIPDTEIYVLSLGRLHLFDAGATDVRQALPGVPREFDGHPGGRALREHPAERSLKYLTEGFEQNQVKGGEVFFYNRLVEQGSSGRRIHAGTSFHGHNCAEVCWGDLLGITMSAPYGDPKAQAFIASQSSGKWQRWGMEAFEASKYLWQRLRAVGTRDGIKLLVSGRERESEEALWGVDDGSELREAFLRFRPRRLTRTSWGQGREALLCVGRAVVTGTDGGADVASTWSVLAIGDLDGDGSVFVRKCLFWDELIQAFEISRAALVSAGFDLAKLPAYLWWEEDLQQNAGGVWLQAETAPTDGRAYLYRSIGDVSVRYSFYVGTGAQFPYEGEVWSRVCFTLHEEGDSGNDAIVPQPGASNAQEALALMPEGTKPLKLSQNVSRSLWSVVQVSDVSESGHRTGEPPMRVMARARLDWPLLWCRVDSNADRSNLATYTQLLSFDRAQALSREAKSRVDICVLVPPGAGTIRVPALDRRN
jgi:hypothetical protein